MSIEIVPLALADIPGAVECVQQAFSDDPYFRWAFDDPSKVRDIFPRVGLHPSPCDILEQGIQGSRGSKAN